MRVLGVGVGVTSISYNSASTCPGICQQARSYQIAFSSPERIWNELALQRRLSGRVLANARFMGQNILGDINKHFPKVQLRINRHSFQLRDASGRASSEFVPIENVALAVFFSTSFVPSPLLMGLPIARLGEI
ncbi:hypothetical protein J2X72_004955 [Phyllobacterium sp. 1468]|uniref:hypothetical protein n=1 Tax=Phyllobacterium sp. 1468 TaxID=2817759 RepID=UPI001AE19B46|nr:hypothetical protein [Phyllobacterium sp. 1468]MDR6636141.1 hypothetical protein [Phyllobacterium sp. 1468]